MKNKPKKSKKDVPAFPKTTEDKEYEKLMEYPAAEYPAPKFSASFPKWNGVERRKAVLAFSGPDRRK